jgi:hypothetical protein
MPDRERGRDTGVAETDSDVMTRDPATGHTARDPATSHTACDAHPRRRVRRRAIRHATPILDTVSGDGRYRTRSGDGRYRTRRTRRHAIRRRTIPHATIIFYSTMPGYARICPDMPGICSDDARLCPVMSDYPVCPATALRDASGPTIALSRAAERATIKRYRHGKEYMFVNRR